jgi:hypothetical protein
MANLSEVSTKNTLMLKLVSDSRGELKVIMMVKA